MGAFVISYVPNVENVEEVQRVVGVDHVTQVEDVRQVDNVTQVEEVRQLDNVTNVETVQDVNTVHDVRKLPHPYYPLKHYNYQPGGMLHVTPSQNTYQAVFVPDCDCEFKGIHICFTSYNIEDTYDVLVGARYVIRGSHVKEMSEYRLLEVYEVVEAGTPIVIQFHNRSGLEKYLLYEVITLIDSKQLAYPSELNWNFYWEGLEQTLDEKDTCTLIVNQPNYVNLDSAIARFDLEVVNLLTQETVATITGDDGMVWSDYEEAVRDYQDYGLLARVNVIGIVSIIKHSKSIEFVFKNLNTGGTMDGHPIEMGIRGVVANRITGGI